MTYKTNTAGCKIMSINLLGMSIISSNILGRKGIEVWIGKWRLW